MMAENMTDDKTVQIGFTVTLSIIAVVNLIGNTFVILIIVTNKYLKSTMNYLLVNLAVADILVGIFIAPRFLFTYFVSHPDGLTGTVICKLLTGGNLAWIGGVASIVFLVIISFERYSAVIHPFSIKFKKSWLKVKYIALTCWIYAVVFNIPLFLTLNYNKKKKFCVEKWPEDNLWLPNAYTTVWFILAGILPVIVMVSLYSRIVYTLWFKRSKHHVQFTQIAVKKSRKRITKMLVIVSIIYCFCWLPNLTIYFLHYYGIRYDFADHHFIISNILITCNSAINPFIYSFQSKIFRRHLKGFLCRFKFCKTRVSPPPNGNYFRKVSQPRPPPRLKSRSIS